MLPPQLSKLTHLGELQQPVLEGGCGRPELALQQQDGALSVGQGLQRAGQQGPAAAAVSRITLALKRKMSGVYSDVMALL